MTDTRSFTKAGETAAISANAIDIIIVNWNSGRQLQECLSSIDEWHENAVRSVIVVDNASDDGSADSLSAAGIRISVVRAQENLGFGRACNLGAKQATAPYMLFLNPDAALKGETLKAIVDFMDRADNADIAALGIKLIDDGGHVQHHTTVRPTFTTVFTHEQRATTFDHLSSRQVYHVIGAFYLIRKQCFDAVGGFDERFFMYLEDLDLSDRLHAKGWRVYYLADVVAFHKGGGVSQQVKARRLFYANRSRLQYSFKHFSRLEAAYVALVTLVGELPLRLARAAARRSWAEARDTMAGYRRLYRDLPSLIASGKAGR